MDIIFKDVLEDLGIKFRAKIIESLDPSMVGEDPMDTWSNWQLSPAYQEVGSAAYHKLNREIIELETFITNVFDNRQNNVFWMGYKFIDGYKKLILSMVEITYKSFTFESYQDIEQVPALIDIFKYVSFAYRHIASVSYQNISVTKYSESHRFIKLKPINDTYPYKTSEVIDEMFVRYIKECIKEAYLSDADNRTSYPFNDYDRSILKGKIINDHLTFYAYTDIYGYRDLVAEYSRGDSVDESILYARNFPDRLITLVYKELNYYETKVIYNFAKLIKANNPNFSSLDSRIFDYECNGKRMYDGLERFFAKWSIEEELRTLSIPTITVETDDGYSVVVSAQSLFKYRLNDIETAKEYILKYWLTDNIHFNDSEKYEDYVIGLVKFATRYADNFNLKGSRLVKLMTLGWILDEMFNNHAEKRVKDIVNTELHLNSIFKRGNDYMDNLFNFINTDGKEWRVKASTKNNILTFNNEGVIVKTIIKYGTISSKFKNYQHHAYIADEIINGKQ